MQVSILLVLKCGMTHVPHKQDIYCILSILACSSIHCQCQFIAYIGPNPCAILALMLE
uniref:Uncharacterized protein n=1 Tax=Zea mays TaxID=4577 RepID=C4J245_MAIZE|nr:unknown [Zea mays]